ncbi:MAG: UDP-N-acetylmuramate--L-alanine ligase [Solirubrobacteraceae bacterium]|nr:UDP-N-acetylmuramate--L-alanine ligase [Solirubrobacteraceae bacterium]
MSAWSARRLHFVGLGGAGMSGLAIVARALGATVTGSDRAQSPYLVRVREAGIEPVIGHDAANVPEGDDVEIVVSTAISEENPERAEGRRRGLTELHRGQLLGQVSAEKRTIAVAGAHGKTTTTSMIAHALLGAGMDPSYLIGGALRTTGTNAAWGTGEWLVVEADESDRSFLNLHPEVAIVTNFELDHHTTYASTVELEQTFRTFLSQAGTAVLPPSLHDFASGPVVEFAPDPRIALAVPGEHNARNAAAALAACRLAGADEDAVIAALATFEGAGRRFERVGTTTSGALIVDDYAHHPTEVAATIAAARTLSPRRVVAVFQPHLFSRTQLLGRRFGEALATADVAVVLDVYPARERAEDFPGVTGRLIAQAATDAGGGRHVLWLPGFDDAEAALRGLLRDGDVCLVMGAGDVDALGRRLAAT